MTPLILQVPIISTLHCSFFIVQFVLVGTNTSSKTRAKKRVCYYRLSLRRFFKKVSKTLRRFLALLARKRLRLGNLPQAFALHIEFDANKAQKNSIILVTSICNNLTQVTCFNCNGKQPYLKNCHQPKRNVSGD